MNFEYLDKFGFDYNKATQELEDDLKSYYTSEDKYTKQLFNKMLELFKTPGEWSQRWFELMWISNYSYRYGGKPSNYNDILGFLDFLHMLVYDTIDDGEIYILKTEAYNRYEKWSNDKDWHRTEWSYGFKIYNNYPYDYEKLGKLVLPEILRNDVYLSNKERVKTEAIKLSLHYVTFENFIEIVDRIIDFSTRKYNAEQKYIKDHNIDHDTFVMYIDQYCKFHDEYPDLCYKDLDYTDIFKDWNILLYNIDDYSLIKNITPKKENK